MTLLPEPRELRRARTRDQFALDRDDRLNVEAAERRYSEGELMVNITADITGFTTALRRAQERLTETLAASGRAFDRLTLNLYRGVGGKDARRAKKNARRRLRDHEHRTRIEAQASHTRPIPKEQS